MIIKDLESLSWWWSDECDTVMEEVELLLRVAVDEHVGAVFYVFSRIIK